MKLIKGDTVTITTGKDKGRSGAITVAFPKKNTIVIKGLNLFKKHTKAQGDQKGGIIEHERPILVSKVALVCPHCKKLTRVGYQIDTAGSKHRICKKCKTVLDVKVGK